MSTIELIETYRKKIKTMKRLKINDILHSTIDEVLPIAKNTLATLEKAGWGKGKTAEAYRRFIEECEAAA